MRWIVFSVLAVLVVAHSSWAAPKPAPPVAAKPPTAAVSGTSQAAAAAARRKAEGWPETRIGVLASQWVDAFSTGEDAMRAFIQQNMSAASLAKKSMPQRLETYRRNREKFGTLMLTSVVKQAPGELTVTLMTAAGKTESFVFTQQSAPPYLLESVGMLQTRHEGGGHFGFH